MKLMIFGGGDVVQRVVPLLATAPSFSELLIVTRDGERGKPLARLFGGCLDVPVRHVGLERTREDQAPENEIAIALSRERPDVVFHAASMISPWLLSELTTPASVALRAAGFGLMLPAQLPLIRQLMRAVRDLGLTCPVVNASYPDLTHPVLAAEGLAPTVGVGNSGMLLDTIVGEMRARDRAGVLQLFAHHAQVTPFARHTDYSPGESPWLFLDGTPAAIDAIIGGPLPSGRVLNALTARHAAAILGALSRNQDPLRTSAPGPLGLPGGWPVAISGAGVTLDMPASVSMREACDYQTRSARADGVAAIDDDGTVHYTDAAKGALADLAPHLAEPLRPDGALARLARLKALIAA